MSEQAGGQVAASVVNKGGYGSFKLEGGMWYKTGKAAPPLQGSNISFSYDKNINGAYTNLDVVLESITQVTPNPTTQSTGEAGTSGDTNQTYARPSHPDTIKAFNYKDARRDAITVVGAAVEAGFLPLKNAEGKKATEAEKFDAFLGVIDSITERYNSDSESFRVLREYGPNGGGEENEPSQDG